MSTTSKPLGGIATLTLGVASTSGAAPTLTSSGVAIELLEDLSFYQEVAAWVGSTASVTHSLTFYTAAEYTLPSALSDGLENGFVAQVVFNSTDKITLGWSSEALSSRPLRLVSCTMSSGEKASVRGTKQWLMESIDGSTTI